MSQPAFAEVAGTTKQTLFSWETGKTAPDGVQIAALAAQGMDVLYVLTGSRDPTVPALDVSERLLVDNYRRCNADGRAHLLQTSALLAAGIAPSPGPRSGAPQRPARGINLENSGANAVQVGHAGRDVNVERKQRRGGKESGR